MIFDNDIAGILAENLLQIKAIKLQPQQPFIWSSGWKSPVYNDNRLTLSYPQIRTYIRQSLKETIEKHFENPQVIAGVATGGIAHGVLVAQDLGLPFVYVRPQKKKHGLGNQIEGHFENGANVVVIEDLISTGKSSLQAVEAIRQAGGEVKYLASIFDYGFDAAKKAMDQKNVQFYSLCNYETMISIALKLEYVNQKQMDTLTEWRKNPAKWLD